MSTPPEKEAEPGLMERLTKFFTSIGGVLTALAAIVGGVAALYVALNRGDGGESSNGSNPPALTQTGPTFEEWQTRANDICEVTLLEVRQIGFPDTLPRARQVLRAQESGVNDLRALERPLSESPRIERLLSNFDSQNEALDSLIEGYELESEDLQISAQGDLDRLVLTGNEMATNLGLPKCAEDPFEQ